jgi:hypothetical protein
VISNSLFSGQAERDSRVVPSAELGLTSEMVLDDANGDGNGSGDDDLGGDDGPSTSASKTQKRKCPPRERRKSRRGKTSTKRARKAGQASDDSEGSFNESSDSSDASHEGSSSRSRPDAVVMPNGKVVRALPFQAQPRRMGTIPAASSSTRARPGPRPRPRPPARPTPPSATASTVADATPGNPVIPEIIVRPPTPPPAVGSTGTTMTALPPALLSHTSSPVPETLSNVTQSQDPLTEMGVPDANPLDPVSELPALVAESPATTTADPRVAVVPEPPIVIRPDWFEAALLGLKDASLGDEWEVLLQSYVDLEARSGFDNPRGTNRALGSRGRPSEVDWWIGRARKRMPTIKDPTALARSFWAWWKGLQPSWREASDVSGPLTSAHRVINGDWAVLDRPGQNGFLSVLAVLSWWGRAVVVDEGSAVLLSHEWREACADVQWVMQSMLLVPNCQ